MKNASFAKTLFCLLAFLLIAPAWPDAQETETSGSAGPASAKPGRSASTEAPHFTFTKKRAGADARLRAIVRRIRRHQHYPGIARRAGVEGASIVSFQILPDGKPGGLRIKRTSGNAVLDRASLEAVRRAAPLPYVEKTLVLTVRYHLLGVASALFSSR